MKQEDKELLLKDLCSRLPYGVKCIVDGLDDCTLMPSDIEEEREIKPYLRPISSMTEEEKEDFGVPFTSEGLVTLADTVECMVWLNSHHFDYRSLIEKALALEAPDGMY
jgi:hypothetical protein